MQTHHVTYQLLHLVTMAVLCEAVQTRECHACTQCTMSTYLLKARSVLRYSRALCSLWNAP